MTAEKINAYVKDFYDDVSIKLDFICNVNNWDLTPQVKDIVSQLSPETMKRYYGSGLIIPEHIEGKRIFDIGCGSGSLVFILSKLVGPKGSVVGMDLSPNLIKECKKQEEYHRKQWGYDKKNTEFFVGNAENIKELKDQSFDLVVSNGVLCLLPNKDNGFAEAYRLLKDCGEFYLNDVYGSMKAPEEMMSDLKAWDLGLTGSQLIDEFHTSAKKAGFTTPYLTSVGPVKVSDEYQAKLPGRRYCCAGNRLFRLGGAPPTGPASVTYKGNVKGHESEFRWDVNLTFKKGQAVTVDGDLATILTNTRYRDIFAIDYGKGPVSTQKTPVLSNKTITDSSFYANDKILLQKNALTVSLNNYRTENVYKKSTQTISFVDVGLYNNVSSMGFVPINAQNPFSYLDELASQGKTLPHIYTVE